MKMGWGGKSSFEDPRRAWRRCLVTAAIACAFSCGYASAQIPEGWEIVEIAPAGTEYSYGGVDINDRGQVVFDRRLWPSLTQIEIFLYYRGRTFQLTDDDYYDSFPRINYHGDIVWMRDENRGTDKDIVVWRNGEVHTISARAYHESSPDVNDAGLVIWNGWPEAPPSNRAEIFLADIFGGPGSTSRQVTNDGFSNQVPYINQHGDFIYTRADFSVVPWLSNVIAFLGGRFHPLTSGSLVFTARGLNDIPHIVWDHSQSGAYLWDGDRAENIVVQNAIAQGINNCGDVPFARFDRTQQNYMQWLWRDRQLFQLTDGKRGAGGAEINNRGEVAFGTGRSTAHGIALFTKPSFAADLNADGRVDLADFALLQRCFGESPTDPDALCLSAEVDRNGIVELGDFAGFAKFFGGPARVERECGLHRLVDNERSAMMTQTQRSFVTSTILAGLFLGSNSSAQNCSEMFNYSWVAQGDAIRWSDPLNWGELPGGSPGECDHVFFPIQSTTVMDVYNSSLTPTEVGSGSGTQGRR